MLQLFGDKCATVYSLPVDSELKLSSPSDQKGVIKTDKILVENCERYWDDILLLRVLRGE